MKKRAPTPETDPVSPHIITLRGQKVIIDADLAAIYGVPTKRLNEQVKRNAKRFPADFAFHLSPREKKEVVANCDHLTELKYSPALPYAFTETGAIMAANVLNSPRAVRMSVIVVRAFIQMRLLLLNHRALETKLAELDSRIGHHDEQLAAIVHAIRQLATPGRPGPRSQNRLQPLRPHSCRPSPLPKEVSHNKVGRLQPQ